MSCFKCGRSGHFARECTEFLGNHSTNYDLFINMNRNEDMFNNPHSFIYDNNNRQQRCYRCNEFGHIARDCLSNNDIRECYNCGQHGHIRTECAMPVNPMLNMNNNNNNSQCYRCGQYGHFARECLISIENNGAPIPGVSNNILNHRICFNCSRTGHIAAACPEGSFNRTDIHDVVCYNCNQPGHLSRNCPDSDMKCYSCGLMGHMARNCSNNRIFSSSSTNQQRSQQMHMPFSN